MTGVSGGTFTLAGIGVLSNGVIFGCNYVTGGQGTSPLKIYMWANESAAPVNVASYSPVPGFTTDRYGAAMSVFANDSSTNIIIANGAGGGATNAVLARFDGSWSFKVLTNDAQNLTSAGAIVDYNAPGFANKLRIIAKSRGSSGQIYSFDPSAAGPIDIRPGKSSMAGLYAFIANGIAHTDYDPVTKLIAGTTATLQTGTFAYTNYILSTASGLATPTLLSSVVKYASAADGGTGQVGATAWGADGRLYTSTAAAGAGVNAFDLTAFHVSGPANTIGIVGDASATLTAVFGGSELTYSWKKGATTLTDSAKYSGTTTASLTVSNLVAGDTDTYTVTVNGVSSSTTNASAVLTVNNGPVGPKTWNGGGSDDNWSTAANWSGVALNFAGDTAFFDGSTRLNPVMDNSYDLGALTFNVGAGAFNISAPSGTLTMGGNVTNNSANEQTLGLPISLSGARTVNTASGNVLVTGAVGGLGSLTKIGLQTLKLRGTSANTFSGMTVSVGTVALGKTAGVTAAGGTITVASGATLATESSEQITDASLVDLQSGNGTLTIADGATETIRAVTIGGALTVNLVKATNCGAIQLGAGAELILAPDSSSSVGPSAVQITAANPAGTKLIVRSSGGEIRWTPTNMVNTFEKLVVDGGRLRLGHGGNAWNGQDTMLGAVPSTFMQDQISITNGQIGWNGADLTKKLLVNANRGMIISGNATNECLVNANFPGKITGPGTLIHNGGGDLELEGANDFSGGLKLGAGAVVAKSPASVGSGPIIFISNLARLAASTTGIVIPNSIDLSAFVTNSFGYTNDFTLSGDVNLGDTGFDPQLNVTNPAITVTFSGALTSSLGLVKNGAGKVSLTGNNNTYGGSTTILNGTLLANNSSGSATSGGGVTVEALGTLGGAGSVSGSVFVSGTIAPGNSVGTLTTADETWNGAGHYRWEMNDATGTAGANPGWDKIVINGALNIGSGPGNEFNIDITSLAGAVAGNAANFNNSTPQSWTILTTTTGVNNFSPGAFKLNTTGFSNPLGASRFAISNSPDGKDLVLHLLTTGSVGNGTGLMGAYYNSGTGPSPTSFPDPAPLVRLDSTVNFDWGVGSPGPGIDTNNFVVRWTGQVQPFYSEAHTFITTTDDGVRLWVNGQLVIDSWIDQVPTDIASTPIALVGGQKYGVVMEYYENGVGAVARLSWSTPGRSKEIIPQTQLYPVSTPAQPTFTTTPDHTQMTITWVGTYVLKSATDINGPWTPVGASSPYTFTIDQSTPQQFFRLVSE